MTAPAGRPTPQIRLASRGARARADRPSHARPMDTGWRTPAHTPIQISPRPPGPTRRPTATARGCRFHNRRYPAARGGTQRIAVAAAQRTRELSPAAGAWACVSRRHGSVQRWRRETSVPWVGALSVAGFALDGWCRVGVFLAGVYLDTFGLYLRRLGHHDLQHAVLRRGLDAGRRAADHGAQGAGGTGQTYPGTRQPETRQPGTNHRGRNQQLTTRPPRELTSPAATAGLSRGGGSRTPT